MSSTVSDLTANDKKAIVKGKISGHCDDTRAEAQLEIGTFCSRYLSEVSQYA